MTEERFLEIVMLRFNAESDSFALSLRKFGFSTDVSRRSIAQDIAAIMPKDWMIVSTSKTDLEFQRKVKKLKYKK